MVSAAQCPALLISASASGQGKTTVTAALARQLRQAGRRVRVFKTGPDFIDPTVLERASGQPVYQLDLWMGGEAHCRQLLYEAAREADLILIEGVMGLFDGEPSSADLAQRLGVPILAVIDSSAMAQTFGAVACGLQRYRAELPFFGVLANRVGSARHAQILTDALPPSLRFCGALPSDASFALPERHLGLLQAEEIESLDAKLDAAAATLDIGLHLEQLAPVTFPVVMPEPGPRTLAGLRIAVARDRAFSFLYRANLDLLSALGAELRFFSPLRDVALPVCDAIYLPGGYPELHAVRLSANETLRRELRTHYAAGKPMLAECGGMMLLFDELVDRQGQRHAMAGVLPGETQMQSRLQALALQSVDLGHGELRGHSFHYSRLRTPLQAAAIARTPHDREGEAIFRKRRLVASYLHFYMPSNPAAAAQLFLP